MMFDDVSNGIDGVFTFVLHEIPAFALETVKKYTKLMFIESTHEYSGDV